jgi:P2 family phage contractile tail tube protein
MNIQIQSLANAAIWLDGASLAGRAAKYDVPFPKKKFEDYKALGLASELELPSGLEKLESTIEFTSFDAAVIQGLIDYAVHRFQVRATVEVHTSQGLTAQLPAVFLMNGMVKDSGKVEGEAQSRVKYTAMIAVRYCQLTFGGVQVYEYDAFANIYTVGGVDQLSQFRANLGG